MYDIYPSAHLGNSLHMMEFKVPEFVNYGQRVTLQVNLAKKSTKKLDITFLSLKANLFMKFQEIYFAIQENAFCNSDQ